jgi:hypothetical protein
MMKLWPPATMLAASPSLISTKLLIKITPNRRNLKSGPTLRHSIPRISCIVKEFIIKPANTCNPSIKISSQGHSISNNKSADNIMQECLSSSNRRCSTTMLMLPILNSLVALGITLLLITQLVGTTIPQTS